MLRGFACAGLSALPKGGGSFDLRRNRERMHYPVYVREGFPIGTGAVEGTCKNLAGARLKGAGMRSNAAAARPMVHPGCGMISAQLGPAGLGLRGLRNRNSRAQCGSRRRGMHRTSRVIAAAAALLLTSLVAGLASGASGLDSGPTVEQAQKTVQRGITFLETDALKWRRERGCSTCHHGTLTIWALNEAKAQGFPVDELALADITAWAKAGRIPEMDAKVDPRPGWRLVSQPAIYLAMASHNLPILSLDEVRRVSADLARRQEADGGYEISPHAISPQPVFFESRETVALYALLAWDPLVLPNPKETAANQAAREKTLAFVDKTQSSESDTSQVLALRYLLDVRLGKSEGERQPRLAQLLKRQNPDGGWGQEKGMGSDAFATGQFLYALSWAGLPVDRPEIRRAVAFLASTQREDGSWAVTPRNYPGVDWKRTGLAMNYFGSAWAMLGLSRVVPSPPDTPARRQEAFDAVLGYHGKYSVDETLPGKPVAEVDFRYYDFDDKALAWVMGPLQAFPQIHTLKLKSKRLTDAGLVALKQLPNLRHLVFEETPLTDAAVLHLKALRGLESLTLKGTKITDQGIRDLQTALPGLKVDLDRRADAGRAAVIAATDHLSGIHTRAPHQHRRSAVVSRGSRRVYREGRAARGPLAAARALDA